MKFSALAPSVRGLTLGFVLAVAGFSATSSLAQTRDPQVERVIEGFVKEQMPGLSYDVVAAAKKEGRVTWYHLRNPAATEPVVREFKKQFPFIQVEEYDNSGPPLFERFMTEHRAKAGRADVIQLVSPTVAEAAMKENALAQYTPTSAAKFDKAFMREGRWYPSGLSTRIVYIYNTNFVKEDQAAKLNSYDALWKENIQRGVGVLDPVVAANGALLLYFFEKEYGPQSWTALAAKKPFISGGTPNADAVTRGEIGLGLTSESVAQQIFDSGAPVRWAVPQPSLVEAWPLAISASAPNPNAAKVLYEFMLSKAGQTIFAENGLVSSRSDVDAQPKTASEPWFTKYSTRKQYVVDDADYTKSLNTMSERFKGVFVK